MYLAQGSVSDQHVSCQLACLHRHEGQYVGLGAPTARYSLDIAYERITEATIVVMTLNCFENTLTVVRMKRSRKDDDCTQEGSAGTAFFLESMTAQ